MSVALLDVNVLIALFDGKHVHHERAHRWLSANQSAGWATCPTTINGCIRILSNPSYPAPDHALAAITDWLRVATNTSAHHFWPDSISLLDESLFRLALLMGHRQLTDAYLLGLAVRNHGRLATFDTSISIKAVHGAEPRHLVNPAA